MIDERFKDTYIRFHNDDVRERLMPLLYQIYRFESRKVAGPHGGSRTLDHCLWSKAEILPHLPLALGQTITDLEVQLDELITYLSKNGSRHMLRFESSKRDGEMVHLTRVAELIRTTGNLHEFQNRESANTSQPSKYKIIEGTQWYPLLRYAMPRNFSPCEIIDRLKQHLSGHTNLSDSRGGHSIGDALSDLELVLNSIGSLSKFKGGDGLKFSEFQVDSIVKTLLQSWTDTIGDALVITADTGMGKTLGFAIPVIVDAVLSLRNSEKTLSQLLLYPRVTLAKDQYNELYKYVSIVNKNLHESNRQCLGLAVDAEGLIKNIAKYKTYPFPSKANAPYWGVGDTNVGGAAQNVYGGEKPSQILIVSIESFRRRLRLPVVAQSLRKGLQRLVFDEVHLSAAIQGGHHNRLVARLKHIVNEKSHRLTAVGISATIAKPIEHLSKIWGSNSAKVLHVDGTAPDGGSASGIMHHVLFKPRRGTPVIGALVDMSSAVIHQRRSKDFIRTNINALQKTIGFADSHQIVGDWHTYMLDNESTSDAGDRRRFLDKPNKVLRRPYAHWHERPLQIHSDGKDVCKSCQKMEYHTTPLTIQGSKLSMFKERTADTPNAGKCSSWDPVLESDKSYEIKGLDTCTYLQAGTCWWFAPREGTIEKRPGNPGYHSHSETVRAMRYTSKTKEMGEGDQKSKDAESANAVFRVKYSKNAFPRTIGKGETDLEVGLHDFAIATPTLEVGVDMDYVSEVITHKAIRNISSYRQKVGRAGREVGSDVMAATLISQRSSDFNHFRSIHELVAKKLVEPVPVALNNIPVQKHHLYEAVFDFLAVNEINVEVIPKMRRIEKGKENYDAWQAVNKPLHDAIKILLDDDHQPSQLCIDYLSAASAPNGQLEHIKRAIEVVVKHLKVFLEKYPNLAGNDVTYYQWLAHYKNNQSHALVAPDENDVAWKGLNKWQEDLTMQASIEKILDSKKELAIKIQSELIDAIKWKDVLKCYKIKQQIIDYQLDKELAFMYANIHISSLKDSGTLYQNPFQLELTSMEWTDIHYLSGILAHCESFLQDRPFIALPSFFTNPHEDYVEILGGYNNIYVLDLIARSDVHRYLQPGMFTYRISKGKRYFIEHGKKLQMSPNSNWVYSIEDAPMKYNELSPLSLKQKNKISLLLDATLPNTEIRSYSIESIKAELDNGNPTTSRNFLNISIENNSRGLIYDKDIPMGGSFTPGVRPKSYPITWTLTEAGSGEEIRTYNISNVIAANDDAIASHRAQRHPLLTHLFESITYHEKMNNKNLAFGVSRSNGVTIQPQQNHQNVVFSDEYTTQGIRFKISDQMLGTAKSISHFNNPFSTQTLAAMGYWIRLKKFGGASSFTIDGYLDTLVQHAWAMSSPNSPKNTFPKSETDFFDIIFNQGHPLQSEDLRNRAKLTSVADDDMVDLTVDLFQKLDMVCVDNKQDFLSKWQDIRAEWNRYTLLNTLGVLMSASVADFAGVQGDSISYTFTDEGQSGAYIDVFDNDSEGNGSCELAMKYLHIPFEIREAALTFKDTHLPTKSVVDFLEQKLQLCPEHIVHNCAITNKHIKGLECYHSDQDGLRERFEVIWNQLKINDVRDASLHERRRFAIEGPDDRSAQLKLELALTVCYDGCPSCNGDELMNQMPPHLTSFATNRGVLDEIMGMFWEMQGYLKMDSDADEIRNQVGDEIVGVKPLTLKEDDPLATGYTIQFTKTLGAGVGFDLYRNFSPKDLAEIVVRVQELV
jgi:hypothetical protein